MAASSDSELRPHVEEELGSSTTNDDYLERAGLLETSHAEEVLITDVSDRESMTATPATNQP